MYRARPCIVLGFALLVSALALAACSGGGTNGPGTGGSSAGGSGGSATAGAGGAGTAKTTGDACAQSSDCRTSGGGIATCNTGWPGGYCTGSCAVSSDCAGPRTACASYQGVLGCLQTCVDSTECRTGYFCDTTVNACVPQ